MRIVMMALGTAGDVLPLTGLGARLRAAGHEVVVAAEEHFRPAITEAGLELHPVAFGVQQWVGEGHLGTGRRSALRNAREYLALAKRVGEAVVDAYDDLVAAAKDADVLLVSYAVAVQGYLIAKAMGIPAMGLYLVPMTPTREFPPALPGLAGRSLGPLGNRIAGPLMTRSISPLTTWVAEYQRRLGLPVTSLSAVDREMAQRWPVRYGFSTAVVARPADWPSSVDVTGYWWPVARESWAPSAELVGFLAGGPPPVLVTSGSIGATVDGRLPELAARALRRAGLRGIIQTGGPVRQEDGTLAVGEVDYAWLMPRLAAVVHHAGAGTAAPALRAGVPHVSVPVAFDNRFWAKRLVSIGVSPGFLPLKKVTVPRLADLVGDAVHNPAIRERCAAVARVVDGEDGAAAIQAELDRVVAERGRS